MFIKHMVLWSGLLLSFSSLLAAEKKATPADRADALRALQSIGANVQGSSQRCAQCHNVNLGQLNEWMWTTLGTSAACFLRPSDMPPSRDGAPDAGDRPQMTAIDRVNCLRENPQDPRSPFALSKMGFYAAGTHTKFFTDLFQEAYGAQWEPEYQRFKATMQMPMGGSNLIPEADFDQMMAWIKKGMPAVEDLLGGDVNAPRSCTTNVDLMLKDHIARMQVQGWEAKNRERGMLMFGCAPGAEKLDCFQNKDPLTGQPLFPESRAEVFAAQWTKSYPESNMRILKELKFRTSYWIRTSADGRFVGYGGNSDRGVDSVEESSEEGSWLRAAAPDADDKADEYLGSGIADLQAELLPGRPGREIKVAAAYDPSFFPDNSGFAFQATPVGAGFCPQSLIEDPQTVKVNFREEGCSGTNNIPTYQAVGASLDGSDYLAVTGRYNSDSGSGGMSEEGEIPGWDKSSYITFTPMIHDGRQYEALANVTNWMPFLGDFNISPSNELVSARMAGINDQNKPAQMGYRFLKVRKIKDGTTYKFDLKEIGSICIKGGKAKFSYDERMFANFHYADKSDYQDLGFTRADDPRFLEYMAKGTANIYVTDLFTGTSRRVTNMEPGQFALFPHYRSDGWLMFLVFDKNQGKRYVVASDASLRMAQAVPLP